MQRLTVVIQSLQTHAHQPGPFLGPRRLDLNWSSVPQIDLGLKLNRFVRSKFDTRDQDAIPNFHFDPAAAADLNLHPGLLGGIHRRWRPQLNFCVEHGFEHFVAQQLIQGKRRGMQRIDARSEQPPVEFRRRHRAPRNLVTTRHLRGSQWDGHCQ